MSDKKLYEALCAGEKDAINSIINKYSKLLWSVVHPILYKVGTVEDMEECVADVFIYLWKYPEKYCPNKGKLKTWLSIVARTGAIDRYREIVKREEMSLEKTEILDLFSEEHLSQPEESLLTSERNGRLHEAVKNLGEPEEEIVVRRYFYGQKPNQIAQAMQLTSKQVENHLYYAKKRLKEYMVKGESK